MFLTYFLCFWGLLLGFPIPRGASGTTCFAGAEVRVACASEMFSEGGINCAVTTPGASQIQCRHPKQTNLPDAMPRVCSAGKYRCQKLCCFVLNVTDWRVFQLSFPCCVCAVGTRPVISEQPCGPARSPAHLGASPFQPPAGKMSCLGPAALRRVQFDSRLPEGWRCIHFI